MPELMSKTPTRLLLQGICNDLPGARAAAIMRRSDGRVLDLVRADPDLAATGCRSAVAYGSMVFEQLAQAHRALELDAPTAADARVSAGALIMQAVGGGHLAVVVRDENRQGDGLSERILQARVSELHSSLRSTT